LINNRQAGRRRGRGGQQQRPQGNSGRQDNGNRIDNRARGNAAQLLEKYKTLARDAQMQGDRVNTEYYLQFADHYFRVLAETRSRFEENRRQNGGAAYEEDEQEYDEDGEPIARDPRQAGNTQDRSNEGQDRGSNQGYRQNEGQNGTQQGGQYDDERPRSRNGNSNGNGNAYGEAGNGRAARDDRGDRNGNDRGSDRAERNGNRGNRAAPGQDDEVRQEPVRQEEPRQEAVPRQEVAPEPVERPRRGRPRREVKEEAPAAFEADRLPPSLSISAIVAPDEPEEKPRKRRGRPPASETTPVS